MKFKRFLEQDEHQQDANAIETEIKKLSDPNKVKELMMQLVSKLGLKEKFDSGKLTIDDFNKALFRTPEVQKVINQWRQEKKSNPDKLEELPQHESFLGGIWSVVWSVLMSFWNTAVLVVSGFFQGEGPVASFNYAAGLLAIYALSTTMTGGVLGGVGFLWFGKNVMEPLFKNVLSSKAENPDAT